jgi:hypothetical protein
VSSSFHACALSIVFRKQFYAISAGERSCRLHSLLNRFELQDRYVENERALEALEIKDIDYTKHEIYIKKHTDKAKAYLQKILDEAVVR